MSAKPRVDELSSLDRVAKWKDRYEDKAYTGWTIVRAARWLSLNGRQLQTLCCDTQLLLVGRLGKRTYHRATTYIVKDESRIRQSIMPIVIICFNGDCLSGETHMATELPQVVWARESLVHGEGKQLYRLMSYLGKCERHEKKSREDIKQSDAT